MLRVKNADGLVSGHTLNVSRITNLRLAPAVHKLRKHFHVQRTP